MTSLPVRRPLWNPCISSNTSSVRSTSFSSGSGMYVCTYLPMYLPYPSIPSALSPLPLCSSVNPCRTPAFPHVSYLSSCTYCPHIHSPLGTVVTRLQAELPNESDHELKKHLEDLVDHTHALKEQTSSMVCTCFIHGYPQDG